MSLVKSIKKRKTLRNFVFKLGKKRAEFLVNSFEKYLEKNSKIIDIGVGTGNITSLLINQGYNVSPVDVEDISFDESIKPVIVNGKILPFDDKTFDTALIITVLHHTNNPDEVLKEASRVAKQVIIIEDVYNNTFHRYITYALDSIFNLEFINHPHSNRDDRQWRAAFKSLGLQSKLITTLWSYIFIKQNVYLITN